MAGLAHTSNTAPADMQHYIAQAWSKNTRRAYQADMQHFYTWGGAIPCTKEQVARYLTDHAQLLSISTLQRRLVSIGMAHRLQGYADPTKHDVVKLTMRGIRREHGKPQEQVAPLLKEDLTVMLSHIPDTIKGKRDRALLLLGFCGALRRSELVAIRAEDLEFTSQGIILTIPRSKTDQDGRGRKVAIPKGCGKICPVEEINIWLLYSGAITRCSYVFPSIRKNGDLANTALSTRAVADIIKYYAKKAGLDPERYSGHSLRAGLATSAAQHGISSWKIREQTGHQSDAMLARYIRDGDLFNNNAAALF